MKNRMIERMAFRFLALVTAVLGVVTRLDAVPVTADEAALAAEAWASSGDLCGAKVGGQAVSTKRHEVNGNAYYEVDLDSGIVFTSSDTENEPIVAMTSAKTFDTDERSPLVALLKRDAAVRAALAALRTSRAQATSTATAGTATIGGSTSQWAALIEYGTALKQGGAPLTSADPRTTVSDVRVGPLLTTKWNQLSYTGYMYGTTAKNDLYSCYNYYTPSVQYFETSYYSITLGDFYYNAFCGCSATALAQVMKYWSSSKSTSPTTYTCYLTKPTRSSSGVYHDSSYNKWTISTTSLSLTTKGSPYAWSSMINDPESASSMTVAQREAIGRLTYDCAVALKSTFSAHGTSASPSDQKSVIKNYFGYSNAQYYFSWTDLSDDEDLHQRAVYASLDAGSPVLMAIYGDGGHCVVGDGYGYANVSGTVTPFVHINMGWGGTDDVWYNLPNVDTEGAGYDNGHYTIFGGVIYNIFPDKTGEVVSGRVLDESGSPKSGVTVIARRGGTQVGSTTTSSRGVYAFVLPSGYSYEISASDSSGATGSVTTGIVPASGTSIGNSWGNDVTLAVVCASDLQVSDVYTTRCTSFDSAVTRCDEFEIGQKVNLYFKVENLGDADAPGPIECEFKLRKSGSTAVIGSCNFEHENGIPVDSYTQYLCSNYSFLQNLAAGDYTCEVIVDDSSQTASFSVVQPVTPPKPVSMTIVGPESLRPGENVAYAAEVTYDNGASSNVCGAVWAIVSGSSYASVDQQGYVTAGVDSSVHSVRLKASYGDSQGSVSGYKTISIQAAIPLNEAVDNYDLSFTTDGDAPWYGQTTTHLTNDVDAAASGVIDDHETSSMCATVSGSGTLSFYYLVSSEANWDWFEFWCDGKRKLRVSGINNSWSQYSVVLASGVHDLEWKYTKDVSNSYGLDGAFVDQVRWTPDDTPVSVAIDASDLTSINAGQSRQLHATVTMSDGSTRTDVMWSVDDDAVASITAGGLLSTAQSLSDGKVTVTANFTFNGVTKFDTQTIVVNGVLPVPSTPVITQRSGDANGAIVGWTTVAYATGYNVYRQDGSGYKLLSSNQAGVTYSDETALPGVDYVYAVEAVNASGSSAKATASAYRRVSLSVVDQSGRVDEDGGDFSTVVRANTGWTASSCTNWATVMTSSGVDGATLKVAVSTNDLPEARTAVITVTGGAATAHPVSTTVELEQTGRIEAPDPADFAFVGVDGTSDVLFPTATDSGGATRILTAGSQFRIRFGWNNVGKGEWSSDVFNVLGLFDSRGRSAAGHTLEATGPFSTDFSTVTLVSEAAWKNLAPGPYAIKVTLNGANREGEYNPNNNDASYWFALRTPVALENALGNEGGFLSFESVSDESWFGSEGIGTNGTVGVMTKHLGDNDVNTLRASVAGAGTLSFNYRVSSASGDNFTFSADGENKVTESGNGEWRNMSIHFEGESSHVFVWAYTKNDAGSDYGDCVFLGNVAWVPDYTFEAPTGVVAVKYLTSSIKVSWNAVVGATSYQVARATSVDGPWTVIRSKVSNNYVYDDDDIVGGVLYYYKVMAIFPAGVSEWSDPVSGYQTISLSVQTTSKKVPGSSGSSSIQVYCSGRWKAEVTSGDWLKVENSEGESDGKLVLSYKVNGTESERKGTIKVSTVVDEGTGIAVSTKTITVTQGVPAELGSEVTLKEAADCNLVFTLSGAAKWVGQTRVSHDGCDALRSGEVSKGDISTISLALTGSGKLTCYWGTSCFGNSDKLECYVAGKKVATITGTANEDGTQYTSSYKSVYNLKKVYWETLELTIPEGGAVVEWKYVKNASVNYGEDAGFVDQVVWTPDMPTPTGSWWTDYGLELMNRLGLTDVDAIMRSASPGNEGSGGENQGKFKSDGTPIYVWEDYAAGTNPLDSDDVFKALISIDDEGKPVIEWSPVLTDEETALRAYQIYGRSELSEGEWEPVPDGHESDYRFFQVGVEVR